MPEFLPWVLIGVGIGQNRLSRHKDNPPIRHNLANLDAGRLGTAKEPCDVPLRPRAMAAARFRLYILEQTGKIYPGERIVKGPGRGRPQAWVRGKGLEERVDFRLDGERIWRESAHRVFASTEGK
jgi:hypothetical protein